MSLNYLEFTTTASGQPVALKVGVPHSEIYTEMEQASRQAEDEQIERFVVAEKELAVLVARSVSGETRVYPTVEMRVHPDGNVLDSIEAAPLEEGDILEVGTTRIT